MKTLLIPVRASRGEHGWVLDFCCAWCGKTHYHGGGDLTEPPDAGHRFSHCHHRAAPSGYELRIVPARDISPQNREVAD